MNSITRHRLIPSHATATAVSNTLRRTLGWLSASNLAADLRLPMADVQAALAALAAEGLVSRDVRWGNSALAVMWQWHVPRAEEEAETQPIRSEGQP